jgi:hypothetical protein
MKTITANISNAVICAFFISIALTSSGLADTNTNQVSVGIGELLRRVEAGTIPVQRGYSMNVHQTVLQTNTAASAVLLVSQQKPIEEEDFLAMCSNSGLVHVVKGLSAKQITQGTTTSTPSGPHVLLTFNPVAALRHLATLNSNTISDEVYGGVPCTKVSGTDKGFEFVLYVSKSDSTIRRQIILKATDPVFDSSFIYTNWGGLYAPLHVATTKPSNGIQIIQDFSNHTF